MKKGLFQGMGQLLLMLIFASVAYAEFGLMLGSFKNRGNAENYAARVIKGLIDDPCNAFVEGTEVPGKGFWYRVCLGPFVTKKEALAKKQILISRNVGMNMVVVKTQADATAVAEPMDSNTPASVPPPASKAPPTRHVSQASTGSVEAGKTKDITLTWEPHKGPAPAGYKIYYDTTSGPPYSPDPADYADEGPPPIIVNGNLTEMTLHGLTDNKDYFFAITAFDTSKGPESPFSEEVAARPEAPPARPAIASSRIKGDKKTPDQGRELTLPKPFPVKTGRDRKDIPGAEAPRSLIPADFSVNPEDPGLLSAGDTLAIEVPGQPEMSRSYDVAPDGNIYMMSIGKIPIQGLKLATLERELTPLLKKFVAKGEKVSIKQIKSERYVQIMGGVRYAGWYHVPATITLKELIQTAGGLLEGVTHSGIKLRRETKDGYRETRVEEGKLILQPNDMLIVPPPDVYQKKVDSGDLLFINVPGRGEGKKQYLEDKIYKLNQFEVDNNGYVYIPDVGHIYVNNLTTAQIKQAIAKKLPKYLARDSKMEVSIIEKRQFVQVLGHVTNPGTYIVREGANVQAALNLAGGAVDGAIMSDARILRKRGESIERIKINLYQFTITGDPRLLTPLHENDILFVPISPNFGNVKRTLMPWTPPAEKLEKDVKQKVRIFGAVRNPGTYEPREDMTLLDLMIVAGGETDGADLSKIIIVKEGKIDQTYNLQLFFSKESDAPLPKIKNGDMVYVKFRELKIFEPEEEKVFYVLGEVKSPDEYKLADNMTLLQAISLAGGLTEWADSENITIVRMINGKQENFRYNLENGISGRVPEWNIRIYPGDTIYVP
ncbi:MAG: SLBB domain-containing protein [Deltaproteobacteria bacterium]|nr:SLBB domain-containing protein [Deltaproteobacteria bacterium]